LILADKGPNATTAEKKTGAYFSGQKNNLLPRQFKCSGGKPGQSTLARSFVAFGAPMKGFNQFTGDTKEKQQDEFKDWFVKDMWGDIESIRKDIEKKADGEMKIYAMCFSAMTVLFNKIFMNDGFLAMGSLFFVFLWMWTATGSGFLALCGIYECFISLFIAMLTYVVVSKYIGFLCVMMIFVIVGIGADDCFVFLDAFKQSAYEPQLRCEDKQQELTLRFSWAYRRSRNAMFVTTATTCVSFLAAGFSEIPTVSAFGFFAAFTVAWDYIMVITFFAAATVIYHQHFEGKKGGHMCIDYKCCCCRLLTPKVERRKEGWRAYKPLICLVSVLTFLGVIICTIGNVNKIPMVPLLGTIILCIAAICVQAVLNMPEDTKDLRFLERFFAYTFHSFIKKHAKKIVGAWTLLVLVMLVLVAAVFRPAEEAPKFLSEEHPIMKFIDLSAEFSEDITTNLLHVVFGIQREDSFDRTGVDPQTPAGEFLGNVVYSSSAKAYAATPAGQTGILKFCDDMRASRFAIKDPSCEYAFHDKTNPTFRLPTLGTEVGHCKSGVYCYMYQLQDYVTAHCKQCIPGRQKPSGDFGCNPTANFTACRDLDGNIFPTTFPVPDAHKILQTEGFRNYMKDLNRLRYSAGHGKENGRMKTMTGFEYNTGGWMGFIGVNFSMPKRQAYDGKVKWFVDTKAFVESKSNAKLQAFGTNQRFNWMVTEAALYRNTIMSFAIAVVFAWIMLVLTGWNWWNGTLGFMAVVIICIVSCGFMVIMGWELGIIESIAIITVVGVSVDYSVHLMHAYGESQAETVEEKVQSALKTMGISLIGGVATTVGAALFLFFAEIQFFSKFGKFLAITVIVSIFVAFTFLMPFVLVCGKPGSFGKLPALPCCPPRQKAVKDSPA